MYNRVFLKARERLGIVMSVADDSSGASSRSARSADLNSLPSELLHTIIKLATTEDHRYDKRPLFCYFPGPLPTLRALLSSSTALRHQALPILVRLAWEGEIKLGRRLIHPSQLFLPAPRSIYLNEKVIRCTLIRQCKPFFFTPSFELYEVDALSPTFVSELKRARPPLLTATESNGCYEIRVRGDALACARLISHSDQLSFKLEMMGVGTEAATASAYEMEAIYQTYSNGKIVPRMISVNLLNHISSLSFCEPSPLMPSETKAWNNESRKEAHDPISSSLDRQPSHQCQQAPGGFTALRNRVPYHSQTLHCWCLDFGGRVKLPSVKNCQLHFNDDDPTTRFQFGKVRDEGLKITYTVDFDPRAMSALQAFAIALTTFKRKAYKGA